MMMGRCSCLRQLPGNRKNAIRRKCIPSDRAASGIPCPTRPAAPLPSFLLGADLSRPFAIIPERYGVRFRGQDQGPGRSGYAPSILSAPDVIYVTCELSEKFSIQIPLTFPAENGGQQTFCEGDSCEENFGSGWAVGFDREFCPGTKVDRSGCDVPLSDLLQVV